MSTKNDITGDLIASKTLSKAGRANWDNIFKPKKTANEWASQQNLNVKILNANGWAQGDGVTLDTPISEADFNMRLSLSTILDAKL
jgi:hypothetical protein